MTNRAHARHLTAAVSLALLLALLVAALLGSAQTLAQTRRAPCSKSAAHTKAKRAAHTCKRASHKDKARHATRRHAKRTSRKSHKRGSHAAPVGVAHCEDGAAPVASEAESFACADGSEPECEGGATPSVSRDGNGLLCAAFGEAETGSSEAECAEEEGPGEASASDASSLVCEGEA